MGELGLDKGRYGSASGELARVFAIVQREALGARSERGEERFREGEFGHC